MIDVVAGVILMGTVWAWVECRRAQRAQAADMAAARADMAGMLERLHKLEGSTARNADTVYDLGKDVETLAERAGVERYRRGTQSVAR